MSQQPTNTASASSPAERYWIRNDVGRVWGPFTLDAISRVNVGKDLSRVHASTDGKAFRPVAEFSAVAAVLEQAAARAAPPPPRPKGPATIPPRAVPTDRVHSADSIPPPPPSEPVVIGVPKEGTLEERSVARLYAQIAGTQLMGKLSVTAGDGAYAIYFKKGTPERVDVPQPAQTLAAFLIQRAVAPAAEINKAVELSGGPDGELVDALFALGVVPQHLLFPLLGEHGTEMLWRVLQTEKGTFQWEEGVAPPPGSFPLGQKWDLLCRWIRKVPRLSVRDRLGARSSCAAYRSSGSHVSLDALRLTAQEARVAASFDGTRSPEQVAFEHLAEPEIVYRTALLLSEVGYLAFGPELRRPTESAEIDAPILEKVSANEERATAGVEAEVATVGKVGVRPVAVKVEVPPAAAAKPAGTPAAGSPKVVVPPAKPAAPPPAAAKPTAPPPKPAQAPPVMKPAAHAAPKAAPAPAAKPAAPVAEKKVANKGDDVAALQALLEKWKKANHFEVLGVPQTSGPADLKAAYLNLARQYHPDTVTDPSQTELKKAKADLIARVNEAYQLLSDTQERTKYIAEIQQGGQVDIGPILQAEEDFLRATILAKARKFAEAIELLDRAIHLNPKEAEFHAWRAWAVFSSSKEKRDTYEESMATCARVIKEMPQCAAAHQFVGQMAKIMGETAKAEKAFRAVLEIDPNNIDAKRELRGKI